MQLSMRILCKHVRSIPKVVAVSSPVRRSPVTFPRKRGRPDVPFSISTSIRRVAFSWWIHKNRGQKCADVRGDGDICIDNMIVFFPILEYSKGARPQLHKILCPAFYYLDIYYRIIRVYKDAYAT